MAPLMAAGGKADWRATLLAKEHGYRMYRQTGTSDRDLKRGLWQPEEAFARKHPSQSWMQLEDVIAHKVKRHCAGRSLEHFAARQAAADLTQVPSWVAGCGPGTLPDTSRAGPGAQAGHWHSQKHGSCTLGKTLPYKEQTEKCEYSKLVCRINFPKCAAGAVYKPTAP